MLDDLLNTSRPAHAKAFAREFLSDWKSSQNASMGLMPSVTEFLDWLKDYRRNVTFRNGRDFWLFRVVPAIDLMIKSVRRNSKKGYQSGRNVLLPLLFVRYHMNYGRDILEDIA